MMTLQDVIDAVQVQPWKYGYGHFYATDENGLTKPHCPLAHEVYPECTDQRSGAYLNEMARRLGLPVENVENIDKHPLWLFVFWWDGVSARSQHIEHNTSRLRELGYRVPTYDEIQWEKP